MTGLSYTKVVADLAGATYENTLCVVDGSLITAVGNPGLIKMMEEVREAIKKDNYLSYKEKFLSKYKRKK